MALWSNQAKSGADKGMAARRTVELPPLDAAVGLASVEESAVLAAWLSVLSRRKKPVSVYAGRHGGVAKNEAAPQGDI